MKRVEINKDWLFDQYIVQNKNIEEIAEILGIGKKPVIRSLKEYSIKKDASLINKKRAETNVEKYGCVSPSQNEEVKNKAKKTNLEKYGFENPMRNQEVKDRLKATNIEKYGVDSVLRLDEFRKNEKTINIEEDDLLKYYVEDNLTINEIADIYNCSRSAVQSRLYEYGIGKSQELITKTIEKTNMEKYGVKTTAVLPEVIEKKNNTNLERYGNISPAKSDLVKEKIKATCLGKYGCEYSIANPEVREKAKETMRKRYNRESGGQVHLSEESIRIMSSRETLREFMIVNNIHTVRELTLALGRGSMPKVGEYLHKYDSWDLINPKESYQEFEIMSFVRSLGVSCYKDKSMLKPYEIDCYCPDYKIGIEFNGTYWHSNLQKEKNYHFDKSKLAESKGIRLIHIYENEWEDPRIRPILESLLRIAFGKVENRIYARNCEVREITNKEAKPFNDANHLQGHRNAQITYGLFYESKLVQLMSFSRHKKYEWEIIRGCPGSNNVVVGGVSKLFKCFVRENQPNQVFSYADFNKFDGRGYLDLGMEFIGYSGPDLRWVIDGKVIPRRPSRHKEYKESADAVIWGAGSKKFLWKNPELNK